MRQLFLKVLAFLLGFKDESYEELEKKGRRIRQIMIGNQLRTKLGIYSIDEIYHMGSIEYSEADLRSIESKLLKGETPTFNFSEFSPSKSYINFYQIITTDRRYFIYAMSDNNTFKDVDNMLMTVELKRKLSTSHLPKEARYK